MNSGPDIRAAVASVIRTAAPNAVVIERNVLNVVNDGWLNILQSSASNWAVRGWTVSPSAMVPSGDPRLGGVEYSLTLAVWQYCEYFAIDAGTGDDSETISEVEREAVVQALIDPVNLTGVIESLQPPVFSIIDLFRVGERMVHIAQGAVRLSQLICQEN